MYIFVCFMYMWVCVIVCVLCLRVFVCVYIRAGSRALVIACIEANHGEPRAAMLHILPNAAPSEHESGRVVLPEAPAARRAAKRPKSGACG